MLPGREPNNDRCADLCVRAKSMVYDSREWCHNCSHSVYWNKCEQSRQMCEAVRPMCRWSRAGNYWRHKSFSLQKSERLDVRQTSVFIFSIVPYGKDVYCEEQRLNLINWVRINRDSCDQSFIGNFNCINSDKFLCRIPNWIFVKFEVPWAQRQQ